MSDLPEPVKRRRSFAIISHPDAGKTTLTEKLLLFGGAIQLAGTVKGRKAARMATSDWMKMEQARGISVTTSVMQFPYRDRVMNLLDTPGHEDFSEDTYRTLTAVDSALMVIDAAKGVEPRTIKLMEVCRLRDTPIISFVNKLDREGRDPLELIDEIESILKLSCAPITWPIGMGSRFKGIYHLMQDRIYLYRGDKSGKLGQTEVIEGLGSDAAQAVLGDERDSFMEQIELLQAAGTEFDHDQYLAGKLSPVFFGSAINNFGVVNILDAFADWAPPPQPGRALVNGVERTVDPAEPKLTGFVFKIQANMDPKHRDRVAFMRVCSGRYQQGMKLYHVRQGKHVRIADAVTFLAADRDIVEDAWPGDILGLHNHGTIAIGDSFSEGEDLYFAGIPNFAPELFRRVVLADPLKSKQLNSGLDQLCEEGATQVFRPLVNNDIVLGAVGVLQFDVVQERLATEYNVNCKFEAIDVYNARWLDGTHEELKKLRARADNRLAVDHSGALVYLASSRVNLELMQERWPAVRFSDTREQKFN